jgi:diguanylate cyclase (GGDEF)-like protein
MSTDPQNIPLWLAFMALGEQAMRDPLTGLYNRRYFDETLANHAEAASRYGRELGLVLFDLDRFKQINDAHGHAAGDGVLRAFAGTLQATARKADIACRIGGDEFAVILPETGMASARRFAERVGHALEKADWRAAPARITATAGIAALPCPSLFAAADADLLARKSAR